jgi:hypothetical protein
MARRRFRVDHIIEILRRLQLGESCRSIERAKLAGRHKACQIHRIAKTKDWLDCGEFTPPEDELMEAFGIPAKPPPEHTSKVEDYREFVEGCLEQGIRTRTIYEALKRENPPFAGSYSSVWRFVQKIQSKKQVFIPLKFEPGECVQVDFGTGPILLNPVTKKHQRSHIFVMTQCFSRHMYVEIVWDQQVKTWLRCHENAFRFFGGVPKKVTIDNLKSAITKACRYDPAVQKSYEEFARHYGFIISPCDVRKPRHKGRVESGVKYVKGSFVPLRDFRDSIAEANRQVKHWVMEVGNRIHGTTRQMPLKMFVEVDRKALLPLPDEPYDNGVWSKVKVHRDCHVTFEKSYYSAPYAYVGETLWLKATTKCVELRREVGGRLETVALHIRAEVAGQWQTNEIHLPGEKLAYLKKTPQYCREEAEKVGPNCLEFVNALFDKGPVDYLRAAQGVLRLGDKFGAARLESACCRALFYDNITHSTIERILKSGLDQMDPVETVRVEKPAVMTGKFVRNISRLLNPEKYRERSERSML